MVHNMLFKIKILMSWKKTIIRLIKEMAFKEMLWNKTIIRLFKGIIMRKYLKFKIDRILKLEAINSFKKYQIEPF